MQKQNFFFSYSRQNIDFVKQLADDLKAAGANVWLDQYDIAVGENWDEAIQTALKDANGILLVLSTASVQSQHVLDEASFALDQGKKIFPLLLEECIVPFRFARKQYIDFTGDYDSGLQHLLRLLAENKADSQPSGQPSPAPLPSGKPRSKDKEGSKAFWSSIPVKLGVTSSILGIILSSAAAFKIFRPDKSNQVVEKEAILKMKELEPRFQASYMIINSDSYYFNEEDSTDRTNHPYFLDYPLLQNEIAFVGNENQHEEGATFEDTLLTRVTYLILQNTGKSTPQEVQVVLKRYVLTEKVTLQEQPGETSSGYQTKIGAKSTDSSLRLFSPPTVLETGKGIRVPLFIATDYYNREATGRRSWNIVSKIVYLPEKVIYIDPYDNEKKEVPIRPMKDPVKVANGIEGRG